MNDGWWEIYCKTMEYAGQNTSWKPKRQWLLRWNISPNDSSHHLRGYGWPSPVAWMDLHVTVHWLWFSCCSPLPTSHLLSTLDTSLQQGHRSVGMHKARWNPLWLSARPKDESLGSSKLSLTQVLITWLSQHIIPILQKPTVFKHQPRCCCVHLTFHR